VHEIAFVDPAHRRLFVKVYPDDLHWKNAKGGDRNRFIQDRLRYQRPRILFADDSKRLLQLNSFYDKLDGSGLGHLREKTGFGATWRSLCADRPTVATFTASRWESLRLYGPRDWNQHAKQS